MWKRLSESLATGRTAEAEGDRVLGERVAALDALAAEYERRWLVGSGQRLTAREFNEGCRETGNGWNATRVARAFGRWRVALDVLHGARAHDRIGEKAARLTTGFARRSRRDARQAVAEWLATKPSARSNHEYDAWPKRQNEALSPDELPYPTSSGIRTTAGASFAALVREALARVGEAEVTPTEETHELRVAGHRLVTLHGAAGLLGIERARIAQRERSIEDFPRPVAAVGQLRLFGVKDVQRFGAGKRPTMEADALRGTVLSGADVAARLGVTSQSLN